MEKRLHKLYRHFKFLIQYLFFEKPKGLDFTMRDTSLIEASKGKYHGYSKTNEKHLHDIFEKLPFEKGLRFLDIGCGKGVVLKEAANYPFEIIKGIEVQKELVVIAKRNFEILGINDKVEAIYTDALTFGHYKDYNVFFLFNPFSKEVLEIVLERILHKREKQDFPIVVIYHNPCYLEIFQERADISKLSWLHDDLKNYDTCIFYLDGKKELILDENFREE